MADLEVSLVGEGASEVVVVGYDSAFEIKAGVETTLDVLGTSRGRDLTGGHLELLVPQAGDHELTFIAPGGATERIRLIVR